MSLYITVHQKNKLYNDYINKRTDAETDFLSVFCEFIFSGRCRRRRLIEFCNDISPIRRRKE